MKVGDTPCQNSKLKPNPSVKFPRHGGRKDLQLQQNCNSTKKKCVTLPSPKNLKLALSCVFLLYTWRWGGKKKKPKELKKN